MKECAVNGRSEDNLNHIADIHLVTDDNFRNLPLGSYHFHRHFEIIVIQQGSVKIMVNAIFRT